MRARAVLLGALVAGGLAGCGGDDGPDPWTLAVDGAVQLTNDGDERRLDGGDHKVGAGDRIEVVAGRAVLTLPDDASLELREGLSGADDSVLRVDDVPELLDGELLLVGADDGAEVVAGAAEVTVADGALRIRRGASVTVGVYAGEPTLAANGRTVDGLRPLRQATVTDSGALPRELQPVTFDVKQPDPWDRRFLGDAIDLDVQIRLRQGAVASGAGRTDLNPIVSELAGDVAVDPDRSVGETVVGAAIARAGEGGDLADRWRAVFRFRDAGAPWGVVALDQRAERADVLGALDGVVRRLRQRFGGVAAGVGGAGGDDVAIGVIDGGGGGGTTPPGGGSDGGGGSDSGGGGGTTPTTQPPTGPAPTIPPTDPPALPLPDLPIIDEPEADEPEPPPPDGSDGTVTGVVGDTTDAVVDATTDVPLVGDVVDDLLDDPGGLLP